MTRTSMIGQPLPRHDALGKVTGEASYPGDLLDEDTLHLKIVYAGRPHACIHDIDIAPSLATSGVIAVLTADDVPFNAFGLIENDQGIGTLVDRFDLGIGEQALAGRLMALLDAGGWIAVDMAPLE